jgi:hypothetical protein
MSLLHFHHVSRIMYRYMLLLKAMLLVRSGGWRLARVTPRDDRSVHLRVQEDFPYFPF